MLIHRWGTFIHLLAITEIPIPRILGNKKQTDTEIISGSPSKQRSETTLKFCEKLAAEPIPDYPSDDDEEEEQNKQNERLKIRETIANKAKFGVSDLPGTTDNIGRSLGRSLRNTAAGGGFGLRASLGTTQSYSQTLNNTNANLRMSRMARPDFRKSVSNFLSRSINRDNDIGREDNIGARLRKTQTNDIIGKTFINDPLREQPRKPVNSRPIQADFLRKIGERQNKIHDDLRHIIPRQRGDQPRDLSQTFRGASYNGDGDLRPDYNPRDDDEVYDFIPMGTLGKAFGRNYKTFIEDQTTRNGPSAYRRGDRNSYYVSTCMVDKYTIVILYS